MLQLGYMTYLMANSTCSWIFSICSSESVLFTDFPGTLDVTRRLIRPSG